MWIGDEKLREPCDIPLNQKAAFHALKRSNSKKIMVMIDFFQVEFTEQCKIICLIYKLIFGSRAPLMIFLTDSLELNHLVAD